MEITTQIKLTKEDIVELIKEKYDGDINFIFEDETYKCGWTDGVQHYETRKVFKGVVIKNQNNNLIEPNTNVCASPPKKLNLFQN